MNVSYHVFQAGFALAIILLVVMAGLCLYSCYLIIRCAEETGQWGFWIHMIIMLFIINDIRN